MTRLRKRLGFYVFVALLATFALLPIVWVLKMSLIPRRELFATPPTILPKDITFSHYDTIFSDPTFRRSLLNSLIIAGSTTVISLVLGSLAAYPLARLNFRSRTFLMTGIVALAFFPTVAIIAPLFVEFRNLGLLNSYFAVILVDTVFALPLAVWILTAFFRKLPRDLEDAAKIDGATTFQAFRMVILPLAAPGVMTASILTFIFAWNEFLFANTFLFDEGHWPATVAIPNFANRYTVDFGAQAAAAIAVTVPLALLVLLFQRRIVSGLTAGAVKG